VTHHEGGVALRQPRRVRLRRLRAALRRRPALVSTRRAYAPCLRLRLPPLSLRADATYKRSQRLILPNPAAEQRNSSPEADRANERRTACAVSSASAAAARASAAAVRASEAAAARSLPPCAAPEAVACAAAAAALAVAAASTALMRARVGDVDCATALARGGEAPASSSDAARVGRGASALLTAGGVGARGGADGGAGDRGRTAGNGGSAGAPGGTARTSVSDDFAAVAPASLAPAPPAASDSPGAPSRAPAACAVPQRSGIARQRTRRYTECNAVSRSFRSRLGMKEAQCGGAQCGLSWAARAFAPPFWRDSCSMSLTRAASIGDTPRRTGRGPAPPPPDGCIARRTARERGGGLKLTPCRTKREPYGHETRTQHARDKNRYGASCV
jgi:hypothetical protein